MEMLERLKLFHVLAAQAPKLPLGRQLEMGQRGRKVGTILPRAMKSSCPSWATVTFLLSLYVLGTCGAARPHWEGEMCVRHVETRRPGVGQVVFWVEPPVMFLLLPT